MRRLDDDYEEIDDDEELTNEDLAIFKKRLLDERAAVTEKMKRRVNDAVYEPDSLPDEIDQASRESEQIALLRLADKERKLLTQIDRALAKFDNDDYGICEGTGDPIGKKRLDARPWTRYSIHHKERLERMKKGG
ncbi:MAG TPA: RNA polymerase-binding protein DksA [Myxococcales bacterium]|nr:RNA polymerase-binding protein DksA [Myxococcales bacterium]HAN30786.1 RNA polymerase-binding protein DksA [Myxococcales bacterium]